MKLNRARRVCVGRVFGLPSALVLLGFVLLNSPVAQGQILDTSEQYFYANAKPMLDYSLSEILGAVPELQGLEPAGNQDELPSILDRAGKVTEGLLGNMPNLTSREDITQGKLHDSVIAKGQRHRTYNYLILVQRKGANVTLEEFRSGPDGAALEEQSQDEDYMVTSGFASSWLHFLPADRSAARFRYLGQQTEGGAKCYVVAFAQKPGWATVTGSVVYKGIPVLILYQGIAWIDEASFRIVRLRTDLLAPRPSIGLERQTTELHFGETRLSHTPVPLWLPQEVVVTIEWNKLLYRNIHRYSDYLLFEVDTKTIPAAPIKPVPTKPN